MGVQPKFALPGPAHNALASRVIFLNSPRNHFCFSELAHTEFLCVGPSQESALRAAEPVKKEAVCPRGTALSPLGGCPGGGGTPSYDGLVISCNPHSRRQFERPSYPSSARSPLRTVFPE